MAAKRIPMSTPFVSASPLWTRAPLRDENGKSYFDFMMLIPGLKHKNAAGIEDIVFRIKKSLQAFDEVVVYIDLNTRLNLLWVSFKPIPEISRYMMLAIQQEIPEARVVAGDFNPESLRRKPAPDRPLLGRIRQTIRTRLRLRRK